MGGIVEINYIVKADEVLPSLKPGDIFTIVKNGIRHYLIGCPLYLADDNWTIVGKCFIVSQTAEAGKTIVKAQFLFRFNDEQAAMITAMNAAGERELKNVNLRTSTECQRARKWADLMQQKKYDQRQPLLNEFEEAECAADGICIAYQWNGVTTLQGFYSQRAYNDFYCGITDAPESVNSFPDNIIRTVGDYLTIGVQHCQFTTGAHIRIGGNRNGVHGITFHVDDLIRDGGYLSGGLLIR